MNALKSHQEQLEHRQTYGKLILKKKEALRLMNTTNKQVEEIDVHYFFVRTDWAAIIKVMQVLELLYKGLKMFVQIQSPLYKKASLIIKLKYLHSRYKRKFLAPDGYEDLKKTRICLSIAAQAYSNIAAEEAKFKLGPLFDQFKNVYDLKYRLLRFHLSSRLLIISQKHSEIIHQPYFLEKTYNPSPWRSVGSRTSAAWRIRIAFQIEGRNSRKFNGFSRQSPQTAIGRALL